jgi:hypothetical protein
VELRRFGVKYTPAGMHLLHRIGWSVQVSRGERLSAGIAVAGYLPGSAVLTLELAWFMSR